LSDVVPGAPGAPRYTPFGTEKARDQNAADLKEFFHVGRQLAETDPRRGELLPNVWPAEVPGFRTALLALYRALNLFVGLKVDETGDAVSPDEVRAATLPVFPDAPRDFVGNADVKGAVLAAGKDVNGVGH